MLISETLQLVNVYHNHDYYTLYELLKERTKTINISHKKMPSWEEHMKFVGSKPYLGWYYIIVEEQRKGYYPILVKVGSIYLSLKDEVGIFIFKRYKGKGFGEAALKALLEVWPGAKKIYANINPRNKTSIKFFKKQGFKPLQNTYVLERR